MKKVITTLTISAIASIMIIGALIASPDAYSSKNSDVPDECACQKPHTLVVDFATPVGETGSDFRFEIFKKLSDRDEPGKLLWAIPGLFMNDDQLTVAAVMFGKDKLESNTAFVVYKVVDGQADEEVALLEIHTSCSQPLFIGKIDENNGYSITVFDGLFGDPAVTSIPIATASMCEDEKKKSTGTITVKKALTNDNGGTASVGDFTITVISVEEPNVDFVLVQDMDDPSINVIDVPAGTYKLSETVLDGYTTVLIAGDTGCPSMLEEVFTIKKGKDLSCIIYNDDTSDGDGIFFARNSIPFDPTKSGTCTTDAENIINNSPCIVVDGTTLFIADPNLGESTKAPFAIITSTIIQIPPDGVELSPPQCVFLGVSEMLGVVGFGLDCFSLDSSSTYNANYAIIDASP